MMRILIADDDQAFLEAVAALTEAQGHEVVGRAGNGHRAVERALELHPDVVLMDVEMPVSDGISATREIVSQLRDTRVVILSGSDVDAHVLSAHTAGAIAHVRKDDVAADLPLVLHSLAQDIDG